MGYRFEYLCTVYTFPLSMYVQEENYPFTLDHFLYLPLPDVLCYRCCIIPVVLSALFVHQLRSATVAVCGDFDRRILLLFFIQKIIHKHTHFYHPFYQRLLSSFECYLNQIHTHTHTPHSLILRFAASRNMEYKLPRALPSPSCFIHRSKLVSQREEFCIYNIIIYE